MNKQFWISALIRALRTICQTAVATIGTSVAIHEVNWITVVSTSFLSGLVSLLMSVATGLPEVKTEEGDTK